MKAVFFTQIQDFMKNQKFKNIRNTLNTWGCSFQNIELHISEVQKSIIDNSFLPQTIPVLALILIPSSPNCYNKN